MRKQKASGLVGRCLLAGGLALGGISGGCIDDYQSTRTTIAGASVEYVAATDTSLNLKQAQALGAGGRLLGALGHQQSRREAGRESRSEVNVNDYSNRNSWNDFILLENGYSSRCKILWVNDKHICYEDPEGTKTTFVSRVTNMRFGIY